MNVPVPTDGSLHVCAAAPRLRKGKTIEFGEIQIIEIPAIDGAVKVPDTGHNLAYKHSLERAELEPSIEQASAVIKAIRWRELVCIEYGLVNTDDMMPFGKALSANTNEFTPKSVAAAIYQAGVRRWLVDTGCPFDLIAKSELDSHEQDFVKKASKFVRLATPNGIVDADKVINFSVATMNDSIEAYVLDSTPTVMSI